MTFAAAVGACLSQFATFSGRARRSEYWWFALFSTLVYVAAILVDVLLRTEMVTLAAVLVLLLPTWAVTVRRLHDTSRSGWWLLVQIIPLVGALVMLVFTLQNSHAFTNQYGPSPKYDGYVPMPQY